MKKESLVCVSMTKKSLKDRMKKIAQLKELRQGGGVLVLRSLDNPNKLYGIYSVVYDDEHGIKLPQRSHIIHKHRETNTLFTIKALNLLETIGNNNANVKWESYRNIILYTKSGKLISERTKLFAIFTNNDILNNNLNITKQTKKVKGVKNGI